MAVDPNSHTLYVALNDATAISKIDTETSQETSRFSTSPYLSPTYLAIAGGRLWVSCAGQTGCLASASLDGSTLTDSGLGPFPYGPFSLASGGTNNHLLAMASADGEPPDLSIYDVSSGTPSLVKSELNPPSGNGSFAFVRQMVFDEPRPSRPGPSGTASCPTARLRSARTEKARCDVAAQRKQQGTVDHAQRPARSLGP